jgi:hypothetical protein
MQPAITWSQGVRVAAIRGILADRAKAGVRGRYAASEKMQLRHPCHSAKRSEQ